MDLTFDNDQRMPGWQIVDAAVQYLRGYSEGQHNAAPRMATAERARNAVLVRAAQPPLGVGDDGTDALVQEIVMAYIERLPGSAFGMLSNMATRIPQTRGMPSIPGRGALQPAQFVQSGMPIPVIGGTLNNVKLPEAKIGGIAILTRELARASAGVAMIETMLGESVRTGLDAVFLSDDAATDAAPGGIGVGATAYTGTADVLADALGMLAALPAAVSPAFLVSTANAVAMGAAQLAGPVPIIAVPGVPDNEAWLVDAFDLLVGTGSVIEYQRVTEACVHMNDAALPIVDGAGTLAMPVTSLWQCDMVGVRAILPVSWAMRADGRVVHASGVSWTATVTTP